MQRSSADLVTVNDTRHVDDESRPTVGVDPDQLADMKPREDWILVHLDKPITKSKGGIAVPVGSIPEPRMGRVVAFGPGFLVEDGKTRTPMDVRKGERLLFERRAGVTIPRINDHLLIRSGSIIASVRERGRVAELREETVEDAVDPAADWALVSVDKAPEQTGGGMWLPETTRRNFALEVHPGSNSGTVRKVGPGIIRREGGTWERYPPFAQPGERVLYVDAEGSYEVQDIPGVNGWALVRGAAFVSLLPAGA